MVIVSKRFLLPALLIIVVGALLAVRNFSKPVGETKFSEVDATSFYWSGQNEGETVRIKPSWSTSVGGIIIPPFNRFSLTIGIDEAVKRLGGRVPLLPMLLPEGMKYADVYVGPCVIICYSYRAAEDYSFTDIGIEISLGPYRVPTPEELNQSLHPSQKLIQINDKWVVVTDKARGWNEGEVIIVAYFYHNDLYYMVNAKPPLTTQDVIKIIESMKTPC